MKLEFNPLSGKFDFVQELKDAFVVKADYTIKEGESIIVANGVADVTITIASGVKFFKVRKEENSTGDLVVISADTPTVSVGGEITGVNINEAVGTNTFSIDPDNANNYLVTIGSGGFSNSGITIIDGTLTVKKGGSNLNAFEVGDLAIGRKFANGDTFPMSIYNGGADITDSASFDNEQYVT